MITENAIVERIDGDRVWVQTIKHSVCGGCAARAGCGQSLLHRLLGRTADVCVSLPPDADFRVNNGDSVEIGIGESAVLTASLVTYGVPIVLFVLGAFLGEQLGHPWAPAAAPALAVGGLVVGALLTRWVLRVFYSETYFEPLLVRRMDAESDTAVKVLH